MKTNHIFPTLCSLLLTIGQSLADPNSSALPGSRIAEESALNRSNIVIAKFEDLGYPQLTEPGLSKFLDSHISIIKSIKGTLLGDVKVSYIVYEHSIKDREMYPTNNTPYLMFLSKPDDGRYWIVKLLPASETNITRITRQVTGKAPL